MSGPEVIYLSKMAVYLTLMLSLPIILAATAVGLTIALIQSLIQLQEQTVQFAAKLSVAVFTFFMTGSWMSQELLGLFDKVITMLETIP